jgi:DNA gyrase/topoisomerase IV subunit A
MVNIDTVLAAVKQAKQDPAEYLAKALKISLEDAQFIGAIPVFQLKRANIDEQKEKIKKIKSEIERVIDDLAHLTRVVVRHLKKLEPHYDERRTKIGARGPSKAKFETTGDPIVMMASRDGKLFGNVTDKGSTGADVIATASYEGAVIFDESGLTSVLSPTECEGKAGPAYKSIVGIAPSEAQHLIVIGRNGNCVKMPGADSQKQSEFNSIKNTQVLAGFGVNDTSSVLLWGKKEEEFACIKASKIKEIRRNTAGTKLVGFKPLRALVVHDGQVVYNEEGTRISITKAGDAVDYKARLFVTDDRNIVIYKSGRRKFFDRATTVKELAKDKSSIRFIYPVSALKAKE